MANGDIICSGMASTRWPFGLPTGRSQDRPRRRRPIRRSGQAQAHAHITEKPRKQGREHYPHPPCRVWSLKVARAGIGSGAHIRGFWRVSFRAAYQTRLLLVVAEGAVGVDGDHRLAAVLVCRPGRRNRCDSLVEGKDSATALGGPDQVASQALLERAVEALPLDERDGGDLDAFGGVALRWCWLR